MAFKTVRKHFGVKNNMPREVEFSSHNLGYIALF